MFGKSSLTQVRISYISSVCQVLLLLIIRLLQFNLACGRGIGSHQNCCLISLGRSVSSIMLSIVVWVVACVPSFFFSLGENLHKNRITLNIHFAKRSAWKRAPRGSSFEFGFWAFYFRLFGWFYFCSHWATALL